MGRDHRVYLCGSESQSRAMVVLNVLMPEGSILYGGIMSTGARSGLKRVGECPIVPHIPPTLTSGWVSACPGKPNRLRPQRRGPRWRHRGGKDRVRHQTTETESTIGTNLVDVRDVPASLSLRNTVTCNVRRSDSLPDTLYCEGGVGERC